MSTSALGRAICRLVLAAAVTFSGIALEPVSAGASATSAPSQVLHRTTDPIKVPPKKKRPSTREWRRFIRTGSYVNGPIADRKPPRHSHLRKLRRYRRHLARALHRAHGYLVGQIPDRDVQPRFGWWSCAVSVAIFIGTNGFPLSKVTKVALEARALYGSVLEIWKAVNDGRALYQFSQDGADILVALLGAGGLFDNCFS